jgi:MFS family permease
MTTPAGLVERLRAAVGGGARLRVVALLAGVLGLSAADSATVGAVAAELKTAFGVGNAAIGLLVTASVGVGALATLPFGVLIDKVNRTQLLSIMILLWCAAMLACGAAVSYPMLLACCRLPTMTGSNADSRSRGTSISTGPASVTSVFGRVPFREFPPLRPAGSCLPYPR